MIFSGVAEVCEWYDDSDHRFHIQVDVKNRLWGPLFGYRGWFEIECLRSPDIKFPPTFFPLAASAVSNLPVICSFFQGRQERAVFVARNY
jgi:hypothetical protein